MKKQSRDFESAIDFVRELSKKKLARKNKDNIKKYLVLKRPIFSNL
jgi:hypothetical protein